MATRVSPAKRFAALLRAAVQAELDALALRTDAEKITSVIGEGAGITDISALGRMPDLKWLRLGLNDALSQAQMDDLQAQLPNCIISF